jgi:hypothetical protein
MINLGLLQEAWAFAQENPDQYNQDSWGFRNAEGQAGETHDIAGIALKLLGAAFVWTPVADYPPEIAHETVWGCQDVTFSSLPGNVRNAIVEHCTRFTKDQYADYFWHSVRSDRCPIGLAARVALGITTADALVLFEEDAKPSEVENMVQKLMLRGAKEWKAAQDQLPEEQVNPTEYLTACLGARGVPVTVVELS